MTLTQSHDDLEKSYYIAKIMNLIIIEDNWDCDRKVEQYAGIDFFKNNIIMKIFDRINIFQQYFAISKQSRLPNVRPLLSVSGNDLIKRWYHFKIEVRGAAKAF